MFSGHKDMTTFLELLKMHSAWSHCADIIDTNVYNRTQLFRAPFAVKAPEFDNDKKIFDNDTVLNVLLPVHPVKGTLAIPETAPSRIRVHFNLQHWQRYLTTVPFQDQQQAFPLQSMFLGS
jgi:hypothetical protein